MLVGDVPRLIDEWQLEPAIWNHVRRAVGDRRLPGQFILRAAWRVHAVGSGERDSVGGVGARERGVLRDVPWLNLSERVPVEGFKGIWA